MQKLNWKVIYQSNLPSNSLDQPGFKGFQCKGTTWKSKYSSEFYQIVLSFLRRFLINQKLSASM